MVAEEVDVALDEDRDMLKELKPISDLGSKMVPST